MRMKRVRVLIDDKLLQEAMGAFNVRSESAAVNCALAEVIRMRRLLTKSLGNPQLSKASLPNMRKR